MTVIVPSRPARPIRVDGGGRIPAGGTTGQALVKSADADYATTWATASGGGVTDGDKGDITVSGSGAVWTIDGGAVSLSKMADLATSTIIGRATAGTGAPEALTAAQVRTILNVADGATANSADAVLLARANHTGTQSASTITGLAAVATSGSAADLSTGTLPAGRMPAHTGDVTSPAGSVALTIANGAVTLAKQANMATASVVYRKTAGSGAPEVQTLATLKTDLGLTGTNTGDQTITLTGDVTGTGTGSFAATIANDAVSNAKLANVATGTFKGRATAGTGDPEDLTGTQATALLDAFTSGAKGLAPASGGGTTNFLRADGTWAAPPGGGGGAQYGPDLFYAFHDFVSAGVDPNFQQVVSGTGAAYGFTTPQDGGVGWARCNMGTASNTRVFYGMNNLTLMRLDLGAVSFKARVRFEDLSDGTDAYTFRGGLLDNNSGEAVDGAFFRYTHSVAGGNLQAVTRSNNTETAVDTGVTVAINTTYKLEVDVNSAGTSAEFRINGSSVATITTNIPTGSGRETGFGLLLLRSAGTAALFAMWWDYIMASQAFTGR